MPDPNSHNRALVLIQRGRGVPVKIHNVMAKNSMANIIVNTFNDNEPIRLLDTSAESAETVHIIDVPTATISPSNAIISS